RDVGRTQLEVLDRIAAVGHHRLDQAVRRRDGLARVVDELRLRDPPGLRVADARRLRERPDVEPPPALLARLQLRLGDTLVLGAADGAVVFGAELPLQASGA